MTGAWVFACIVGAFAGAGLCLAVFNAVPAKWLCDYGEQPEPELEGTRLLFWPHGTGMALILAVSFLLLHRQYSSGNFYFYAGCTVALILLLIAAADLKYRIIPDQFILALLAAALIFDGYDLLGGDRLFHSEWFSPVLGAAAGAGLMFLLGQLGRLAYHKEALGFGDVKLFGAVGLLAGFPQIFLIFFMMIFLAFFYIIVQALRGKQLKNRYLPLGPYICLALFLFLAFRSQITILAGWYFSLLNL